MKEQQRQCEMCHGDGFVVVEARVYPNEPHMASVGTQECLCQLSINNLDEENGED